MSSLEAHLRRCAPQGLRLHLWQRKGGGFQASVAEPGVNAWTCVQDDDPVNAAREALRQRCAAIAVRTVEAEPEPEQIDIEEAIAAAEQPVDEFAGLLA